MDRKQLSRRDFMRGTAAAVGATYGTRTVVLEPGPLEASPCPVPPSDRVRFGLVGVGGRGSGLLGTTLQISGAECAAAADVYDGHLGLAKEIMGEQPVTTTRRYQELLESKDIDCIICATPDHWHKQVLIDCCNAGKDIYCEKPMSHGVSEGYEMAATEQRTGARCPGWQPAGQFHGLCESQGTDYRGCHWRHLPGGGFDGPERAIFRLAVAAPSGPLTSDPGLGHLARPRAQDTFQPPALLILAFVVCIQFRNCW